MLKKKKKKIRKYGFWEAHFSKNSKAEALDSNSISTSKENFDQRDLFMISYFLEKN